MRVSVRQTATRRSLNRTLTADGSCPIFGGGGEGGDVLPQRDRDNAKADMRLHVLAPLIKQLSWGIFLAL